MRSSRRTLIPQRRRVFLGCEGESERGYGARLGELLETVCQDVYLDVVLLNPGAGDPLALVERARQRIADTERKRERYAMRAILLDADKRGQVPERDAHLLKIAAEMKLTLIWQEPCHEALLLRHLENCRDLRPPTTTQAMAQLTRHWPSYTKGLSAMRLAERIGLEELRRVQQVEKDLAAFLVEIGFN
jgi:hypothetical protein